MKMMKLDLNPYLGQNLPYFNSLKDHRILHKLAKRYMTNTTTYAMYVRNHCTMGRKWKYTTSNLSQREVNLHLKT